MSRVSSALTTAHFGTQRGLRSAGMRRVICVVGFTAMLMMLISVSFAAGSADAIQNGIKDGASQIYNILTAIIIPLGAVFIAWNGAKIIFGGERAMEAAKKNMLNVVIAVAIVYLAPLIILQVGGWFSSIGNGGVFDHTGTPPVG